jgi:hypothetical protein
MTTEKIDIALHIIWGLSLLFVWIYSIYLKWVIPNNDEETKKEE